MDNYFLIDVYNVDRLIIKAKTQKHAEKAFYNKFGYFPDIIKIIDDIGGTIATVKGARFYG